MAHEMTEGVYTFIRDYIREHRIPPSIREIATGCYIGRSSVVRYLDKLEAQGRLILHPGQARGISLTEDDKPSK